MSVLTKIGELMGFKSAPQIISSPDDLARIFGAEYVSGSGQPVTPLRAMQLAIVFSCVRVLSESMGMLPCRLYKQTGKNKEPAINHKLNELLTVAPNDYMTPQEFWELLMVCLCLRGNFYAYKVYALGQVVELLPIDPASVTPKLNDNWEVEYQVNFKKGGIKTLSQKEIWHVRLFTLDGLNGLNPIAFARKSIALGLDTEEHGSKLFKNGAVTSGVLETEASLTDAAFNRLKTEFAESYTGLANTYKPMILEQGLKWKPTALNLEDSQFLETREYQKAEICGLFRVPPHLVAAMDKMTLNNIEHMGMSFVNYSLVPYMTRIESRIKVGLLNEEDRKTHYAKFNAGALLRGDLKTRYEAYGKGIQWGFLSPNDCRELEDLNPREGGDIYLTPMNMTTKPEEGEKMEVKYLNVPLKIKSVSDSGEFEGYASVFGVVDSYSDVVMPGAFQKTLEEWSTRKDLPSVLWQHKMSEPIGPFTEMKEDDHGLFVRGRLLINDDPLAKRAHAHMKAGSVKGMSIGYILKDWEYDQAKGVFLLKEIDLWEVSIVTMPANTEAKITEVKTALRKGEIPPPSSVEKALRDVMGLSQKQAKAFMSKGYSALNQRDVDSEDDALQSLKDLKTIFIEGA